MLKISNHYVSKIVCGLLLLEFFILLGSFYAGAGVRLFDGAEFILPKLEHTFMSALLFAAILMFSMGAMGMYQHDIDGTLRSHLLRHLLPSFGMGFCLLTLLFYAVPSLYFGRGILVYDYLFAGGGILAARAALMHTSRSHLLESRIMVLGTGALAQTCGQQIGSGGFRKYNLVGYVSMASEEACVPSSQLLALEPDGSLLALALRLRVREIVVSVQNRRGGAIPIRDLLECKLNGIAVTDASTFFERETCQIRVESMQPSWLVFGGGFDQSFARTFMKRVFDIAVSLALLILTLPLMLLTALAIFLEDGAPIFYSQERVGRDSRVFKVHKFRSMRRDAEKGMLPQWAGRNDSRITRVGGIIRKLRIDELPQILNVLKGEMSLVGPRPERPFFVDQLNQCVPYYNVRHSIKPGITGWAQVRYGYGDSVEDALQKLQYDMYYVKNHSLLLDLLVLIDTFEVVVFGAGR
ncbi:TIGR03013 family XrtA/PEP-CTERM system glycosyltransferase [Rugamonas sp.]|uniref:TIGR03013 family XrtA/PEP-CTERM system glycosyltransferase n=1 Tax=Rugamonas sp. TaxID=1926287 RepID=UPI0025DE5169|nr:TIGR03013 family XrtA/PEP-CTERM system glycosyltransferase [Rugamonas sp.]